MFNCALLKIYVRNIVKILRRVLEKVGFVKNVIWISGVRKYFIQAKEVSRRSSGAKNLGVLAVAVSFKNLGPHFRKNWKICMYYTAFP